MSPEAFLDTGQDRSCRADRQLLAGNLEHQGAEGVELRKFVHPGPRTKALLRVDQLLEDRIRRAEEGPCLRIGDRRLVPLRPDVTWVPSWTIHEDCSFRVGCQSFRRRSVSTIRITSSTVSWRFQSRWSSQASET